MYEYVRIEIPIVKLARTRNFYTFTLHIHAQRVSLCDRTGRGRGDPTGRGGARGILHTCNLRV